MPNNINTALPNFYLTGAQDFFMVDNVAEMKDNVFVQVKNTIINDAMSAKKRDVAEK